MFELNIITIEPLAGQFIGNFADDLINAVKNSNEPNYTVVKGTFNDIELTANIYTHKTRILNQYHSAVISRNSSNS